MKSSLEENFKKGETGAFTEIYRKFLNPIQKYVFIRVPNESIAQEITQDIFLKAFRFSAQYEPHFAITTWLWTIAKNTVSDFKKQSARFDVAACSLELVAEVLPSPALDPESSLELKKAYEEVQARANSLTPIQQKILSLRYTADLSYREIAEQMGLSLTSVKTLLFRARMNLQVT